MPPILRHFSIEVAIKLLSYAGPKKPRREFTREIRVKLTEAEITDRGRQLATKREEHAALDGDRKATAKSFGGRLAQITAQLGVPTSMRDGERRPVQPALRRKHVADVEQQRCALVPAQPAQVITA